MALYGDPAHITNAHNLALRRIIAAVASVLEFDRESAESSLAVALSAVKEAERIVAETTGTAPAATMTVTFPGPPGG